MSPDAVLGVLESVMHTKTDQLLCRLKKEYPDGHSPEEGMALVIEMSDNVNEVAVLSAEYTRCVLAHLEQEDATDQQRVEQAVSTITSIIGERVVDGVNTVDSAVRGFFKDLGKDKKSKKKKKKG